MRRTILLFFFSFLLTLIASSQQIISYPLDNHDRIKAEIYPDSVNIKYTHDAVGNIITKIVNNPCSERPTPIITPSGKLSICNGDSIQITAPLGLTYKWSRGDTSRSIWVKQDGIYTVLVNLTQSCQRLSLPDTVILHPQNLKIYTPDSFFCPGYSTTLTSSHNGTFKWSSGDSTKSITADTSKIYTLSLTDSTGCKGSVSINTGFYSKPVVSFYTPALCPSTSGYCLNTSTISNDSMTYLWNFGDGSALKTSPYHTYSLAGIYTVKLIATSSKGCKDSASNSLIVDQQPKAYFTTNDTSQCLGNNSYTFRDTTKVTSGLTRLWDFGDATIDTSTFITKTYQNSGSFKVKLVLTSTHGCKDSISKSIVVKPKPNTSQISGVVNSYTSNFEVFSVLPNPGSLYNWQVIKGINRGNNGLSNFFIKFDSIPGLAQIKVVEFNNQGCFGDTGILKVALFNNPFMELYPKNITFPKTGGFTKIALNGNINWNISNIPSWLNTNKSSGYGNDSIEIITSLNQGSNSRNAYIVFSGANKSDSLQIYQDSIDPSSDFLTLDYDTIISPFAGNNTFVTLNSNRSWSVNSNKIWAAVSPTVGSGNDIFNIITQFNSGLERNALITVTAGSINKYIYVHQYKFSTGINKEGFNNLIEIYPNPTSGILYVDFKANSKPRILKIINVLGEVIIEKTVEDSKTIVNFEGLPKGIYFIKISFEQEYYYSKVILE